MEVYCGNGGETFSNLNWAVRRNYWSYLHSGILWVSYSVGLTAGCKANGVEVKYFPIW